MGARTPRKSRATRISPPPQKATHLDFGIGSPGRPSAFLVLFLLEFLKLRQLLALLFQLLGSLRRARSCLTGDCSRRVCHFSHFTSGFSLNLLLVLFFGERRFFSAKRVARVSLATLPLTRHQLADTRACAGWLAT